MNRMVWVLLLVTAALFGSARVTTAAEDPQPVQQDPTPDPVPAVVRIDFENEDDLAVLTGALDIWEVHRDQGYVVAMIVLDQWSWLRLLGYTVTVDVARSAELNRPLSREDGQTAGIPGYACYRTVEETYATLAGLAATHPEIAEWKDIGDSYDKATPGGADGYDLQALVLTNRNNNVDKGKLLVLAAVHARELAPAEVATRFAEELATGYGVDADITWLLDYNEIHIIAQGNPDGRKFAEQGYSWRKNTDSPSGCSFPYYGVDLNRNVSFLWAGCATGGCSSTSPCSILYRGVAPASEPETQALEAYMQSVFADQRGDSLNDAAPADTNGVFISLHSYGNLVIYPWDWTGQAAPNVEDLRRLGRKFGYFNRYSVCNTSNCLYAVDGSHTDYAYGIFGVGSYTFEVGTTFFQSCSYFDSYIVQQNLDALFYAAKAARRPYQRSAGPDSRDLSLSTSSVNAGNPVTLTVTADDSRYFSNGYGSEAVQTISAVRYSVGQPVWAGGTPVEMTAVDGLFGSSVENASAVIDTNGWPSGRHTIFVESQDAAGNWGALSAIFLDVTTTRSLEMTQHPSTEGIMAGRAVTHTLQITNTGNAADAFVLTVDAATWPVQVSARRLSSLPMPR
ncbi:MAG: M14 family zinc carboxypeptidase [Caldilineaceae bacterium]